MQFKRYLFTVLIFLFAVTSLPAQEITFKLRNFTKKKETTIKSGTVLPHSNDKFNIIAIVPSHINKNVKRVRFYSEQTGTVYEEGTYSLFSTANSVNLSGKYDITAEALDKSDKVLARGSLKFSVENNSSGPDLRLYISDGSQATKEIIDGGTFSGSGAANFELFPVNVSDEQFVSIELKGSGFKAKKEKFVPYNVLTGNERVATKKYKVVAKLNYLSQGRQKSFQKSWTFNFKKVDQPAVQPQSSAQSPVSSGGEVDFQKGMWRSSFENGFYNSEWTHYDNGSFRADGSKSPLGSTWTIVDGKSEKIGATHSSKIYKSFIHGVSKAKDAKHRPYPVIHFDKGEFPSIVVNEFDVYMPKSSFDSLQKHDWIHLATYASNSWWQVVTLVVMNNEIVLGHTDWTKTRYFDANGNPINNYTAPKFEWNKWVKITTVLDFRGNGKIAVYVNGVKRIEGAGGNLSIGSDNLMRAHWGIYTTGDIKRGVQYNDNIKLWAIKPNFNFGKTAPKSPF